MMNENSIVYVPGSTSHEDFNRCVRAIKARMNAFQRGPVFLYSPVRTSDHGSAPDCSNAREHSRQSARLEQVRALQAEIAGYNLPDEAAYLMRTSGSSSGTGKIVLLSTEALTASARATEKALGGPGRWTVCLPPSHIAGFQTIFRSLLAGTEPLWAGGGKPHEIRAAVQQYRERERAYLSLVPTQLSRLLDDEEAACAARRYHAILVGGASCPGALLAKGRALGLNIVQTYGMTETCGGCVYDGVPLGDTVLEIGEGGRITILGSCVGLGYAGGRAFSGVFVTQDSGAVNREGRLEVHGRLDGAITSGGVSVIPEIVESHLADIGCGQSVVVGIRDDTWGEAVCAIVEKNAAMARERLSASLEKGWVPSRVFSLMQAGLADFPRLPSGKIDRETSRCVVEDMIAHPACP